MTQRYPYNVFVSMNFEQHTGLLLEIVKEVGEGSGFNILSLRDWGSLESPAKAARSLFERASIEGLLVLVHEESSWISNEIGMAYAFHLPVCVISKTGSEPRGISKIITSMRQVDIFKPAELRVALREAFDLMKQEISESRKALQEPPALDRPIVKIGWSHFLELVLESYKKLSVDVDSNQRGYKPTLILGISRGGIIVADMISRLSGDRSLGLLEADRAACEATVRYPEEPMRTVLMNHLNGLDSGRQARILVVDDVIKSGRSLHQALDTVNDILQDMDSSRRAETLVKSLVLVVQGTAPKPAPDYSCLETPPETSIVLPYGLG